MSQQCSLMFVHLRFLFSIFERRKCCFVCLIPDERARCYGGAGPVGTGPIQRPTYTNIVSVMKSAIVTSRTSLLLAALAHRATGSAAPMTAASEMRRRWCAKNERVCVGGC